jgi:endonuclease/exonuclease/phosphatase family metal-dependent hydrolase
MRIIIANTTSWNASWRGLAAANADVYCVQEARIATGDLADMESEAKGRGLMLHPSDPDDGEHLMLFAHRSGRRHLRAMSMQGVEQSMRGRMQYAVIHFGRRRALHIVQLYGVADGSRAATDFNASLMLAAVAWLRSLGDVPSLVVGDFNLDIAHAAIDAPLAMAGWVDVLAEAGPTCIPSTGAPSRIDYVFANRPAKAFIRAASVRWDLGLATHAALELEIRAEAPEKTLDAQVRGTLGRVAVGGLASGEGCGYRCNGRRPRAFVQECARERRPRHQLAGARTGHARMADNEDG